jgi:flagellin-like protein
MKTFRKLSRRAISPLIATIILIAICVAGGLLVYTIFFSTAGTITAKGQLTVEAVDLVKAADGTTFSITVKNSGNKPLEDAAGALKITLNGEAAADVTDAKNLQPGQSVSYVNSSLAKTYVVGNVYTVVIQATFSDGSTSSTTTSVQCRSG